MRTWSGSGTGDYPRTLTYRQAADVQPFANTLVNMDLTGAQIKQALEQQWQPAGAQPTVPAAGCVGGLHLHLRPDARPRGRGSPACGSTATPIDPAGDVLGDGELVPGGRWRQLRRLRRRARASRTPARPTCRPWSTTWPSSRRRLRCPSTTASAPSAWRSRPTLRRRTQPGGSVGVRALVARHGGAPDTEGRLGGGVAGRHRRSGPSRSTTSSGPTIFDEYGTASVERDPAGRRRRPGRRTWSSPVRSTGTEVLVPITVDGWRTGPGPEARSPRRSRRRRRRWSTARPRW